MKAYIKLAEVQEDLQNGKVSCEALVSYYLERIENHKHLNAYLEVFKEEALAKAKELDQKLQAGQPLGRLFGLVLGVKDVICYKNHEITAASKILKGFTSTYSATAIERLVKEDVIIIGRLNCDEFAMGSTNENSAYGPALNADDTTRVAGGSSGGSSVAVQADLCLAALGSDTGGSVRQPASFCNVVGIKPTYGRISRHGLIAFASSFDQIGTLTKSVEDAALLIEIMAGKDNFDSTVSSKAVPSYSALLEDNGKPKKIAYFKEAIEHPGLDPEIKAGMIKALEDLANNGHEVKAVNFPYLDYIVATYYILTTAEASSNLSRYDGIHYGYRDKEANNMEKTYRLSRTKGFGKEVKRRIMLGTFVLSAGYYDAYYSKAQKVRRIIQNATKEILATYDFIVTPTVTTTAFKLGDKDYQDPVAMYLADIFTVQANIVGMPAASLPLFKHANGMSFGLQIMADKFCEDKLLAFSKHLLNEYDYRSLSIDV